MLRYNQLCQLLRYDDFCLLENPIIEIGSVKYYTLVK